MLNGRGGGGGEKHSMMIRMREKGGGERVKVVKGGMPDAASTRVPGFYIPVPLFATRKL